MPIDSCWESNLNSLRQYYPDWLAKLPLTPYQNERIQIIQAADGSLLTVLQNKNGELYPLGDLQSPTWEAAGWVDHLGAESLHNANVLLMGWGSGYHPLALFQQSDVNTFIWIVEPNPTILQVSFHYQDFTSLLKSSRVCLLVGMPAESVAKRLFSGPESNRLRAHGVRMAVPPMIRQLYPEYIKNLANAISESIQFEKLKLKTEEQQGNCILQNSVRNIPYILRGAPVLRLQGSAAAFPAAVIAPGPSLEAALDWLRRYGNRMLIIAVDTAHRILQQNGIQSDMVVSLDYTELNARHFETISQDTAILAAFVGIDPKITEKYVGKTYFYTHEAGPLIPILSSLGTLGELISFGSTAHAAYHLARLMGCSPIILVGNDLGFPAGRWYAPGAMQNDLIQPERENEILLEVPANDGGILKTSGLYKIYLEGFSELIQKTAGMVINTSLQGAKIPGCPWMSLEAVTKLLPKNTLDKSFIIKNLDPSLEAHRADVMQEVNEITEACRRAQSRLNRLIKRIEGLQPSIADFPSAVKEALQDFSCLLLEESRAMSLCPPLCTRSTTAFLGQLGTVGMFGGKSPEQNRAAQERCLLFLQDYQKALETNQRWLSTSELE